MKKQIPSILIKHGLIAGAIAAWSFGAIQASAMVLITNHFDTDPQWTGLNHTSGGNNYGYCIGTTLAGGTLGEVGGTFRRTNTENYYADTSNFGGGGAGVLPAAVVPGLEAVRRG